MRRALAIAAALVLATAATLDPIVGSNADAVGGQAAAAPPRVGQLVVFRDGGAVTRTVSARAARVRVGGRRCVAGAGTPLAALLRSRPGRVRLRDFGSCSRRARDGGGLFVDAIRGDVNRGQNGWVYKVGRRAATAGAADPQGPFGHGRLRAGQRVTWFYCHLRVGGCERTLELKLRTEAGAVLATVRGFDDEGHGVLVEGATVVAGGQTAPTGVAGVARLGLSAGRHTVVATNAGMIRSFGERVVVP